MNLDPSFVGTLVKILTAFAAAFTVTLWVSLLIWTYRDIRGRARDPLMRVLAILVVALLFLPGVLIYLILRPPHTLEEEYQHTLEEEALLQSIEDNPLCPGCGRRVLIDWIVCPNCHTKLKKPCQHCGKLMELPWNLCPYCGTPSAEINREDFNISEPISSLPTNGGE